LITTCSSKEIYTLYTVVQRDEKNSTRHRWVQLTGPSKVAKTSAAKYIAQHLKLYDIEGPDGVFWVGTARIIHLRTERSVLRLYFPARFPHTSSRRKESRRSGAKLHEGSSRYEVFAHGESRKASSIRESKDSSRNFWAPYS